ncbi:MAG: hypothetical protein HS116_24160 [Planctomycetes bacterium]|nr:hypothetical protein [Planctomycetota bacterium]
MQGPTGTLVVNGKTLSCRSESGSIVTGGARINGLPLSTKLTRFQRVTSAEVPFGGVVKYFRAPHDGKSMAVDSNKPGQVVRNANDKVELLYEVTEFGRGR